MRRTVIGIAAVGLLAGVPLVTLATQAPAAGSLDSSFSASFNNVVFASALTSDGKLIVGGGFNEVDGTPSDQIVRLNPNGSLDPTFKTIGTGVSGGAIRAIEVVGDKVVLGGTFTNYNGTSRRGILRLNSNGSLDTQFLTGTGFNDGVYAIDAAPGGKLWVGGGFSKYGDTSRSRIALLQVDGQLDPTFDSLAGFDQTVLGVARGAAGDVWVGGQFSHYRGVSRSYVARLTGAGELDAAPSNAPGLVRSMAVDGSGHVIAAGQGLLTRYQPDGSVDPAFTATLANQTLGAIAIQQDGKILATGQQFPTGWVGRFNTDGTFDKSFATGGSIDQAGWAISLMSDGKIFVAGQFTKFNGSQANRAVRLLGDSSGIAKPRTPIVVVKPTPPRFVTVSFKKRSAKISWVKPTNSGNATVSFQSRLSKRNSAKFGKWRAVSTSKITYSKLRKGSRYRVQVRAVNKAGASATITESFKQKR